MPRFRLLAVALFFGIAAHAAAQTDLAIVKSTTATSVVAGNTITYTITLTNNGPNNATNVSVTDAIPVQGTFVSFTAPAGWTTTSQPPVGSSGTVIASNPLVANGSTHVFTLVVRTNPNLASGGTFSNTASLSSVSDNTAGNNSSTVGIPITTSADLAVTKTGPATVIIGNNATYTVTLTNNGPSTVSFAQLNDIISAGAAFVSITQTAGPAFTCTPQSATTTECSMFNFAPGASATFSVVVTANGGPTITNTAQTFNVGGTDPDTTNNTASVTTAVTGADMTVSKVSSAPDAPAGGTITYTINVSNSGTGAAANATLTDTLPANTTFASLTAPAGWTCALPAVGAAGTVSCSTASLAAGANAAFTLVVNVSPTTTNGTTISNTATVSTTTPEFSTTNNSATTTVTVFAPDLFVTKNAPATVTAGSPLAYTIQFFNASSAAANATMTDVIPANTTFTSIVAPLGWTCSTPAAGGTGTVSCTIASFVGDTPATFTLNVQVTSGVASGTVISNTATASTTSVEPNTANNSATATTTVAGTADVSVTKSGPASAQAGSNISYTIVVTNSGTAAAASVSLNDTLAPNLTFQSLTVPAGWTCAPPPVGNAGSVVICSTASLAAGATANFTLVAGIASTTASGATVTNTATVSTTSAETSTANNTATASTTTGSTGIPALDPKMLVMLAGVLAAAGAILLKR